MLLDFKNSGVFVCFPTSDGDLMLPFLKCLLFDSKLLLGFILPGLSLLSPSSKVFVYTMYLAGVIKNSMAKGNKIAA